MICKEADPSGPDDYNGLLCSLFLNQLRILNKTLVVTTRYELQLVAQRFLKGKLGRATIEQYSFDVTVIVLCDAISNCI
jgi:hypothetical protein